MDRVEKYFNYSILLSVIKYTYVILCILCVYMGIVNILISSLLDSNVSFFGIIQVVFFDVIFYLSIILGLISSVSIVLSHLSSQKKITTYVINKIESIRLKTTTLVSKYNSANSIYILDDKKISFITKISLYNFPFQLILAPFILLSINNEIGSSIYQKSFFKVQD